MTTATEQAWSLWDRVCHIGGQGLTEGHTYRITDLQSEAWGSDMILSTATVIDADGNSIDIKNAHIAFDIDDILEG